MTLGTPGSAVPGPLDLCGVQSPRLRRPASCPRRQGLMPS